MFITNSFLCMIVLSWISGADSFSSAWCKDILMSILQTTPMGWPSVTLQYFPQSLAEFFREHPANLENKVQLKSTVDTEYSKWKSMWSVCYLFGIPLVVCASAIYCGRITIVCTHDSLNIHRIYDVCWLGIIFLIFFW